MSRLNDIDVRLARVEENQKNNSADLKEIKTDVKAIRWIVAGVSGVISTIVAFLTSMWKN